MGVTTRGRDVRAASRRSRVGIKFIAPINHTYGVELPKYQNTENPKYHKSKVPNLNVGLTFHEQAAPSKKKM